jgi:UDP-N-acetylmuramoyl-tripeptide--D-alanyl-D-alanine ligase
MKLAVENFARLDHQDHNKGKLLVLGAMAELGEESLAEHKGLVDEIKKYPWENVLLVGGDFEKIEHPFLRFKNATEAGEWLKSNQVKDKYLLIKGSRSMAMEKVLEYL